MDRADIPTPPPGGTGVQRPEDVAPYNERSSLCNDAARHARCVVQVVWPGLLKAITYFTDGLPLIEMRACRDGQNMTISFFVPDREQSPVTSVSEDKSGGL
jgi:hypothetical protein